MPNIIEFLYVVVHGKIDKVGHCRQNKKRNKGDWFHKNQNGPFSLPAKDNLYFFWEESYEKHQQNYFNQEHSQQHQRLNTICHDVSADAHLAKPCTIIFPGFHEFSDILGVELEGRWLDGCYFDNPVDEIVDFKQDIGDPFEKVEEEAWYNFKIYKIVN